jgi:2-dehydropantoate 2-reductase
MRIATMATGGIGGYLAVKLAQAGTEVACIARGAHLAAIRDRGLSLSGPEGEVTVQPWRATDDPAEVGPVDAVIFGVKGDGLLGAAQALQPMLGPYTVVVPFLNGVEATERLAGLLPGGAVAKGVARISTTVAAPGVIGQTGSFATFVFAEADGTQSPRLAGLRAALQAAGVAAPVPEDIDVELWRKFVFFSAVSGVTAAGRCRMGDVQDCAELAALFRSVLAETTALGRALGVALPEGAETEAWAAAEALPREMRASTAVDLEAGRPVETRWINGAVVRLAAAAGLPVPANATLAALLAPHCPAPDA